MSLSDEIENLNPTKDETPLWKRIANDIESIQAALDRGVTQKRLAELFKVTPPAFSKALKKACNQIKKEPGQIASKKSKTLNLEIDEIPLPDGISSGKKKWSKK